MERTLPKLSGHLVILALSVAVTLSVRTALKAQYSQERRQIEAQAREKRARQMASAWNALPLTGITTPDFAEAFLARLDLGTLHLTSAQTDRLQPRA